MKKVLYYIGPVLGGLLFAIGLGLSGMTEPKKVIGFLDVFGDWDPSLIFVMVGAIAVNAVVYRFVLKMKAPLFDWKFHLPTSQDIDFRLIFGAALFGIGWGVSGLCPGPGLSVLTTGTDYALIFVGTMLIGVLGAKHALSYYSAVRSK